MAEFENISNPKIHISILTVHFINKKGSLRRLKSLKVLDTYLA
jgi:hypothetical protein